MKGPFSNPVMPDAFVKTIRDNRITIVAALVVLVASKLVFVKYFLSLNAVGPQVPDEVIYKITAEMIFRHKLLTMTHYPPFYSLLLSFSFFSEDHWYDWMLYTNVLLSSLVLIPVWLISVRLLPRAASFAVILITALSSFHFYYPRFIMSENLHIPLFSFSILLLLSGGKGTKTNNIFINTLFGASMALGYLTKYLFLAAIPVLIIMWWVKPLFNDDPDKRRIMEDSRCLDFLAICSGFVLTYAPWLITVHLSHIPIAQGMGEEFVTHGIPTFATFRSLALWIGFYLSYAILASAPFLPIFSLYLFMLATGRIRIQRQEAFFMITLVLLSCIFLATAIQHSWRARYNYPVPNRIMGRYVMHLMPLWIIALMIALNKVKYTLHRLSLSQIIFCFVLCFASISLALDTLTGIQAARKLVFDFINSADAVLFLDKRFVFGFFLLSIIICCILAVSRHNRFLSERLILIFSLFVLLIQLGPSYVALRAALPSGHSQLHGRALSQFIKSQIKTTDYHLTMISDDPELLRYMVCRSIPFWLSESIYEPPITFISLDDYRSCDRKSTDKQFLITRDYFGDPLYRYVVQGHGYYIYDFESWFQKNLPGRSSRRSEE